MLKLNRNGGRDWFTIADDCGCTVSGTTDELNGLYNQIGSMFGKRREVDNNSMNYTVILDNDCNGEKVQMKLSKSAYNLLCYLIENDWFDNDTHITEVDETEMEVFI